MKKDITTTTDVREMVEGFYSLVLNDETLAPIFLDVAEIDISEHLPRICSYYEKMILGMPGYSRHTMNIHRNVHAKFPLRSEHFSLWLRLFKANIDNRYQGPNADRAKNLVSVIADNMIKALNIQPVEHDKVTTI